MTSSAHARRRTPSKARRRWIVAGLLLLLLVGLALLALPLLKVPGEAQAAKTELTTAATALQGGDTKVARRAVVEARRHADAAQDAAQGIGGDVWSRIPFVGTPVADARHLVQALDDATSVAEIGIDLYPSVAGPRATLFADERVDEATLDAVLEGAEKAGKHLRSARSELDDISASTPVVGDTIAANRDAAAAQVEPLADGYDRAAPFLQQLPDLLGFEGERSYLIAMLNPAELRFSGGAALSYAVMRWDSGRLDVGETISPAQDPRFRRQFSWRKVKGNNLHSRRSYIANATFAPSWSVSGAELVRAWQRGGDEEHDGVVAVDVVALGRLLDVSGPLMVPALGEITGASLVETLVGSYDDYYPDATAQDAVNQALIPGFQAALFGGGGYVEKARALGEAADGRHFALYFRDLALQDAAADVGLTGDLADPAGDYLFVGTQNTNGSKVDYYQRRSLDLEVRLDQDGTASNRLGVSIDNDTPPFVDPAAVDPQRGYFTRWAGMRLGVFLPPTTTDVTGQLQGQPADLEVRPHFDHQLLTQSLTLEPGAQGSLVVNYEVPEAASKDDSGGLTYRLAVDPQGTVNPAALSVSVRIPSGFSPAALPEGWSQQNRTLSYRTDQLQTSTEWEIPLSADN